MKRYRIAVIPGDGIGNEVVHSDHEWPAASPQREPGPRTAVH